MCVVRATELMNADWFQKRKAKMVFIGSGGVHVGKSVADQAKMFQQGARLLVDPSTESRVYRSLGAKRGVLHTFSFSRFDNLIGLIKYPLEIIRGRLPLKSSGGDVFLQGATFVFSPNGELLYRQIELSPGYPKTDYLTLKQVIENQQELGLVTVKKKNQRALYPVLAIGGIITAFFIGVKFGQKKL